MDFNGGSHTLLAFVDDSSDEGMWETVVIKEDLVRAWSLKCELNTTTLQVVRIAMASLIIV